jgi:hypothetical protein
LRGGLGVPDLTYGAAIKLNTRLSLQSDLKSIACPHPAITEAAARYPTHAPRAVTRHPVAYLEGQAMSDKKHANAAHGTFRSSDRKKPLTEYEEQQKALLKNFERLKAERLAREAAAKTKEG